MSIPYAVERDASATRAADGGLLLRYPRSVSDRVDSGAVAFFAGPDVVDSIGPEVAVSSTTRVRWPSSSSGTAGAS